MQVLKIAILAERDADDYSFYVDIILNLIRVAGDYVSAEVCPARPVARSRILSRISMWVTLAGVAPCHPNRYEPRRHPGIRCCHVLYGTCICVHYIYIFYVLNDPVCIVWSSNVREYTHTNK